MLYERGPGFGPHSYRTDGQTLDRGSIPVVVSTRAGSVGQTNFESRPNLIWGTRIRGDPAAGTSVRVKDGCKIRREAPLTTYSEEKLRNYTCNHDLEHLR